MGKGQNDEGGFSEEQVQMYKDCFKLMDINKDGTLDKNDLRGAFDNIGVLMSEGELDELMGEVGGPCNVMGMVNMFQENEGQTALTHTVAMFEHQELLVREPPPPIADEAMRVAEAAVVLAVRRGHGQADGHRRLARGRAAQVLEDGVEVCGIGAVEVHQRLEEVGDVLGVAHHDDVVRVGGVDEVVELLLGEGLGLLPGADPVDVPNQGVDLAVVPEHAERLRERPARLRVGREAPVVDGKVRLEERILQVVVEGAQHRALDHPFVDDGAGRERGNVRRAERVGRHVPPGALPAAEGQH